MKTTILATGFTLLSVAVAQPPPWITGAPNGGPWSAVPTQYASQYSSWINAHSSEFNSLTSLYASDWNSWASAVKTLSGEAPPWLSALPSGFTAGGPWGPGGPGGPGKGWRGPPFAAGWGPWGSAGPWTAGPWTSWWNQTGTYACPPATWSGWTEGPWASGGPWTSWSGCSATTTASSVVTTTLSGGQVTTTTSFGVQLAEATPTPTTPAGNTGNAAANMMPRATAAFGGALAVGLAALAAL